MVAPAVPGRYNAFVRPQDIRVYLDRDWQAVAAEKDRYWVEQRERGGIEWAFEVADELRRHVLALQPSWPSIDDRDSDLAVHSRVSASLRRVRADPGD